MQAPWEAKHANTQVQAQDNAHAVIYVAVLYSSCCSGFSHYCASLAEVRNLKLEDFSILASQSSGITSTTSSTILTSDIKSLVVHENTSLDDD